MNVGFQGVHYYLCAERWQPRCGGGTSTGYRNTNQHTTFRTNNLTCLAHKKRDRHGES
jgi:hypothetical protein